MTGGLVILASLAYDRSRRSTSLLLAAVAIASITKLTVCTAVGAAMLILLARFVMEPKRRSWRVFLTVAGTVAAAGAVFVALSLAWYFRPVPAVGTAAPATAPVPDVVVPWWDIKTQLFFNFLPPDVGNFNASFLESPFNTHFEQLVSGMMLIGVLAAALALRGGPKASALGVGVVVMAVLGPVILTVLNARSYNVYFPLPPRYGDGILAGLAGTMAWTFRAKAGERALVLLAIVSFVNVFV